MYNMIWFIFALLTAFFESLKDVSSKKSLKNIDVYIVSWSFRFFALLFLLPLLLFIEIPPLGREFWTVLPVAGVLGTIATILYMKAIKSSEISITIPMITFTPLFLLITSPIIVNEFPNFAGLIGVLLIVTGSYLLNVRERNNGYIAPFRKLLSEPGPKLMLLVAFIWSISSNFDKIGVLNSSPIFWVIAVDIFLTLILTPIMLYRSRGNLGQIRTGFKALIPIGLFSALTLIFQMNAIKLALVAYVISVKRTSAIMSVLLGYFIFREKGIKERLIGVMVMVTGVMFIALS
jgi:uncharacterized membrane protein